MLDYFIAFINSDLFFSLSGAAFGAAGGGLAVREIDQREKRKKALSNLNSGIVLISNALNTLLSFKRNTVIPMCEEFHDVETQLNEKKLFGKQKCLNDKNILLKNIIAPQIDLGFSFDFLSDYATINPNALVICQKSIESIAELKIMIKKRNALLDNLNSDSHDSYKTALRYLGLSSEKDQVKDNLYCFSKELEERVDTCLFFVNKACKEFSSVGFKIIPKKWHKSIVKTDFVKDQDKDLLPPQDYIGEYA